MSDQSNQQGGIGGKIIDITELLTRSSGLKGGSGDGTSGGMESRIARLESDMEHVKKAVERIDRGQDDLRKTVTEIKVDFGKFDERSKHFPTKGFIFSVSAALLAAGSGIMAILIKVLG